MPTLFFIKPFLFADANGSYAMVYTEEEVLNPFRLATAESRSHAPY